MSQIDMRPRISVCMATFNGIRNIREQLDTILCQLGARDEIIICDDGSTDGTIDLIRSYSDDRIKLSINDVRVGAIRNFEGAIARASGEIIFLSDQDDVWRVDKVAAVCDAFKADSDVIAVVSDARVVGAEGEELMPSFFAWRNSAPGFWRNWYKNGFLGCAMAFRSDILSVLLPFPKRIKMHDEWIGLCCTVAGRVVFLREQLIDYRRHQANHTKMTRGTVAFLIGKRIDHLGSVIARGPAIFKWRRSIRSAVPV